LFNLSFLLLIKWRIPKIKWRIPKISGGYPKLLERRQQADGAVVEPSSTGDDGTITRPLFAATLED